MKDKVLKALEIFMNKDVIIEQSGLVASQFIIKKLTYIVEDEIVQVRQNDEIYMQIDLNQVTRLYLETDQKNLAILILQIDKCLEIEIRVKEDNRITLKEKFIEKLRATDTFSDFLEQQESNS